MNFYQAQADISQRSYWLVALFVFVNLLIISLTTLFVVVWLWFDDGGYFNPQSSLLSYFSLDKFLWVTAVVCGGLLVTAGLKWLEVVKGGAAVAESLGGQPVQPGSRDISERRLLNVVEEMSIAAGVPVPPVYVLREEAGINAFAAGLKLSDAIICVSQGALEQLDRDQLQGVVAHEMSHIFNGDMRLNMRLLVALHGLMWIGDIGRDLLFSRASARSKPLGLGLYLIGGVGIAGGSLIKAAVGRQREYLADASAVRFTRNPAGLAGALKAIGSTKHSSRINNHYCHEVSHLFFACIDGPGMNFLATHPPLRQRIQAIEPGWDGRFSEDRWQQARQQANNPETLHRNKASTGYADNNYADIEYVEQTLDKAAEKQHKLAAVSQMLFADSLTGLSEADLFSQTEVPEALLLLAHDSFAARAILPVLLLEKDETPQAKQYQQLSAFDAELTRQVEQLAEQSKNLSRGAYLPWVLQAMPALKLQSATQYRHYKRLLMQLIHADQKVDLFEWCLYQLTCHYCDSHFSFNKQDKPQATAPKDKASAYQIITSMLVWHGRGPQSDVAELQRHFSLAANTAGFYQLQLLSEDECSATELKDFTAAVRCLAAVSPLEKARYLAGLVKSARKDGQVSVVERELLTAVAALMESPLTGLDKD